MLCIGGITEKIKMTYLCAHDISKRPQLSEMKMKFNQHYAKSVLLEQDFWPLTNFSSLIQWKSRSDFTSKPVIPSKLTTATPTLYH